MTALAAYVGQGAPASGAGTPILNFAQWLASTNSGAGPTRFWPMNDTSGTTMTATIGGINGTYQNPGGVRLGITDAEAEKWVGLDGGEITPNTPGHVTITTPLQSAAFTAMALVQFDKVKAKHTILSMGASTTAGQFSLEVVDDGLGMLKPRVFSVDDALEAVIGTSTNPGVITPGEAGAGFYVRRADGTQEVWMVNENGAFQIPLSFSGGTVPGSWSAHPAGTWYVGAWSNGTGAMNGVMRGLALWNVALSASDIARLATIQPFIQNVVWAAALDAGAVVESETLADVNLEDFIHPEVGYSTAISTQGSRGTWAVGSQQNLLNYTAGATAGSDIAGRYTITRGGVTSPTPGALTVAVEEDQSASLDDSLPFFGLYYGGGTTSHHNGEYELKSTPTTWFFWAEKTGTVSQIQWHVRTREPQPGYSLGDGGTYTIEIVPANPSTKAPVPGASAVSRLTGYNPGNPAGQNIARWPLLTFTQTPGQTIAGQPYCLVATNTHASPGQNFVSQNATTMGGFAQDPPPNYMEPGDGTPIGDILVASGGINGSAVGSSPAIIRGWLPHHIDGHDWYPFPMGYLSGHLEYSRIGGLQCTIVYSDGTCTGWGRGSAESNYRFAITGSGASATMIRERFKVTRASRVVKGVFIRAWQVTEGGNVLVRLESGPDTDSHTAGAGTPIEEVSVAASHWLFTGDPPTFGQASGGSATSAADLVHYVYVPFTQNRTLTLGQIYNLVVAPSGCNIKMVCPARGDSIFGVEGSASTWAAWETGRRVSWTCFEDSRGCQVSTNGGTSWAYGPSAGKQAPIVFKCV